MRPSSNYRLVCAVLLLFAGTGCSEPSAPGSAVSVNSSHLGNARYELTAEPSGAIGVIEAREAAANDASLTVVGRIGGSGKPWIDGLAAFVLVDASISNECKDEACPEGCTCCAEELANATALIKFVDPQGRVIPVDARQLLGLEERQIVVVHGKAKRDKQRNLVVMADGIFVRR